MLGTCILADFSLRHELYNTCLYARDNTYVSEKHLNNHILGIFQFSKDNPYGHIYYNEEYFLKYIKKDPVNCFKALVDVITHEAIHLFNAVEGVKDADGKTGYHNERFRDTADMYGLDTYYYNDKIGYATLTPYDVYISFLNDPIIVDILTKYAPLCSYF